MKFTFIDINNRYPYLAVLQNFHTKITRTKGLTEMKKSVVYALVASVLLSGCAAPVRVEQMTAAVSPQQRITQSPWRTSIAVRHLAQGEETDPAGVSGVGSSQFEQALEASLRAAGLLAEGKQPGKYALVAQLENIDQSIGGIDTVVTATVLYTLVERASGKPVLTRRVWLPFAARSDTVFARTERLRLANEGAVRVNIAKMIDELLAVKVSQVAMN